MSISPLASSGLQSLYATKTKAARPTTPNALSTKTGSSSSPVDEFLAYAHMSPAERLRAAYLKSHNLTEEKLAAMSPEERRKIEDAIRKEIEEKLKRETERKALGTNLWV